MITRMRYVCASNEEEMEGEIFVILFLSLFSRLSKDDRIVETRR